MSASERPFGQWHVVDQDMPNTSVSRVTDSLCFGADHFLAQQVRFGERSFKKSFSKVSWPILACSRSRSTFYSPFAGPSSKTPAAPCRSSLFQAAICVAWKSYFCASSARVCSARKVSNATHAVNTAPWFRLGRLMCCSPRRHGRYPRPTELASHPLYPTVRKT